MLHLDTEVHSGSLPALHSISKTQQFWRLCIDGLNEAPAGHLKPQFQGENYHI